MGRVITGAAKHHEGRSRTHFLKKKKEVHTTATTVRVQYLDQIFSAFSVLLGNTTVRVRILLLRLPLWMWIAHQRDANYR